MKRILVTGGAGYIGSLVVEELLKDGFKPVVFDSFLWGKDALEDVADQIEMIEGDIRSSADVTYAMQGIDAVIHLAGLVGEPACKRNAIAHHTINVEATHTVVNAMTDPDLHHVPDLIFASSCSVYGNAAGLFDEVREGTEENPLSEYAAAKLRAEKIIMAKAAEFPNFHPTIMRLTTLFGWSRRPRLDLVTNLFVYKALREGKLTITGSGEQYRSLVHVRDVARAAVHLLKASRFMRDRKIFHIGDEANNRTVKQIAQLVAERVPGTEVVFGDGPTDRRDYQINCQKMRSLLDFHCEFSVEDGIQDMVDNISKSNITFDPMVHSNAKYDYK